MSESSDTETLALALAHRRMMWWYVASFPLGYGTLVIEGIAALSFGVPHDVANMIVLPVLASLSLLVAVFAFQTASAVYGVFPAFVCALFVFVPCMGLIAVLILNGEIAEHLKKRNLTVGFMGATKQQIQEIQRRINSG